jgi:glycine/D-amino acid oxidase-like deaminating enzyme
MGNQVCSILQPFLISLTEETVVTASCYNSAMSTPHYDVIVIGGGFYGCSLALFFRQHHPNILLLEKETDLLQRASLHNQARVHQGYHYPRSYMTALRSRANYAHFLDNYADCIDQSFDKLYAIAKHNSKVTSRQFSLFCKRIGAPLKPASKAVKKLFNPHLIEDIFQVEEVAFNAKRLKEMLANQLASSRITVRLKTEVTRLAPQADGKINVITPHETLTANKVINATYANINTLLHASHLPPLPIKYELTEMALVETPPELSQTGITVMDGPFFSIMPYPAEKLHSLSHVRYTPHLSWTKQTQASAFGQDVTHPTHYPYMIKDAQRYLPSLKKTTYQRSFYEIKALLQQHEVDDGRPILYRNHYGINNFAVIMGGKIDNIYDILALIQHELAQTTASTQVSGL